MNLWRVCYQSSDGMFFYWHTTKASAMADIAAIKAKDEGCSVQGEPEKIYVSTTRMGMARFLNQWAGDHNG